MSKLKIEDYYIIEKASNGVATIWMDQKGEKINKIGPELIELFDEVFVNIEKDPAIKAVVLISKKKDFIAGADIESFQKVTGKGDFEHVTRKGHEILNRIANSKKPVVAAIHGNCLGAGLEIALACTARIASDDKSTKMALPEVKLGLLPGGGGTQRLPRLVGLQKALDMMLTGKNIFARPALKMGLVDKVANKEALYNSAVKFAVELTGKPINRVDKTAFNPKDIKNSVIEGPLSSIVFNQARKMVDGFAHGNYPAPYKILECVETGWKKGMKAGLDAEAIKFEELILSPQSRQLINIFFAMTEKKKNPWKEQTRKVDKIAMLGAGFMGAGIAEVSITDGIDVLLKDVNQDMLSSAYKTVYSSLNKKVQKKAMTTIALQETMAKLSSSLDFSGFKHVDIVIEAVFEDLSLKQKILAEVEANTRADCIFASNTSALPIKAIAEKAKRPELVIGMHYFSPVPKMPLLEIIKTDQTADWVVGTCYEIGLRQGKTVIVVNDGPGFYTTRILAPLMNEAQLMLEEGGDILHIDKEMNRYGFPVGPITLADEVGIDVGAHIMSGDLMKAVVADRNFKVSTTLIDLFKAGYKGRKNKMGFYRYDAKGKKVKGAVNLEVYNFYGGQKRIKHDANEIRMRGGMAMVNEAALCLQEGIITSPLDGDIGAIFGLGFPPFLGGPFRYIDTLGASEVVRIMNELAAKHGDRFKPAQIIVEYAKLGKKFYDK